MTIEMAHALQTVIVHRQHALGSGTALFDHTDIESASMVFDLTLRFAIHRYERPVFTAILAQARPALYVAGV